jgi:hypothetical protein
VRARAHMCIVPHEPVLLCQMQALICSACDHARGIYDSARMSHKHTHTSHTYPVLCVATQSFHRTTPVTHTRTCRQPTHELRHYTHIPACLYSVNTRIHPRKYTARFMYVPASLSVLLCVYTRGHAYTQGVGIPD